MPEKHREFVRQQNIGNFRERLKTETDPKIRKVLLDLLAREQALGSAPSLADEKITRPAG